MNWPVQSQKKDRSLKLWIYKEEGLHYLWSKKEKLISCVVTAQLICGFVFAYADCWFSVAAAEITVNITQIPEYPVRAP